MATAIADWENKIMPDLPNVPYPAMLDAVRDACIKFCEETRLWTYTLDRISVVANTSSYALTPPAGGVIIGSDEVKYKQDGMDDDQFVSLAPLSREGMDRGFGSGSVGVHSEYGGYGGDAWEFQTAPTPSRFWLDNDKNLKLYRIPTVASDEGLLVRVILKPTDDCTTVEDFIWDDHRETIARGARADLLSRKGQPWYDPELAGFEGTMFRSGYNDARWIKTTDYTKRNTRVRMRAWL